MADIPGDPTTTAVVTVGSTTPGAIETIGDHDWYKVTLAYGQSITVTVTGSSSLNTYLNIYDPTGTTVLASNDDIGTGGNTDSRLTFTPTAAGTYFIGVGASHNQSSGTYDLFVEPPSLNVWSYGEIANELSNYYWGGDVHHWNVAPGGTLTVNISGLTTPEQNLAVEALADWTDISGIKFQQVTWGGQITFSDAEDPTANGPVAQTDTNWANGIITSANIEISKSWITNYGTSLDSYSFQTYIHEIGHALGLGHAGDYNLNASYPMDALYANDAWSTTVMSYFSPHDNSYFNNQGFSADYDMTPMVADLLAIQQLYGLSSTTRTGDTTYGYHSTADNPVYNAALYPDAAYTIYDSGGNDTLDYSGSSANQLINLNPETFSNVNGQTGNVMIAPGVVIENAIGGSADDTIIQNSANNVLDGGAGTNTVSYETATAGVTVNLGLTTPQDTGGAGIDTLSGFEKIIGSPYADVLIGGPSTLSLSGGAGDDFIEAGTATGSSGLGLYGGDGNDTFIPGTSAANIWIDGGAGFNTIDFSSAAAGVLIGTSGSIGASPYMVENVQKIVGSNYADTLYAWNAGDILVGGGGDDNLTSVGGNAQLIGGPGNDTYNVWTATDQIIENPGEGIDTVIARASYTLGPNLENLQLYEYKTSDPYAGASLPPPNVQEDWSATGNDLSNVITGNAGDNVIDGLGGADTLTGGGGNDTFLDTLANHNGDTITDFHPGDALVFSDASLGAFTFSVSGNTLIYTGGSMTLEGITDGKFVASAAPTGGVQLTEALDLHNDFNGDGRSDVLWQNDNGTVTDWLAQSDGSFVGNHLGANSGAGWSFAGTGDFNGDGRADVFWRYTDGTVSEWLGQPGGSFATSPLNINPGTSWHLVGTGDFNGDGRTDLFWQNDSGLVTDWLAQANGTFAGHPLNLNPGTSWHVVGTGDFNGDGRDDLLWQNDSGLITEWLAQPDGTFVGHPLNLNPGGSWRVVGTGDFNGDGRADVLWQNTDGTITDWLGQPNGNFVGNHLNLNPGTGWHVVTTGDFNGDGRADMLLEGNDGTVTQWFAQADGNFIGSSFSLNPGPSWHVLELSI